MTPDFGDFYVLWPWPLTFRTENWQSTYSCRGERLCQFRFFRVSLFSSYEPVRHRRTGKTRNAAIGRPHDNYYSDERLAFFTAQMLIKIIQPENDSTFFRVMEMGYLGLLGRWLLISARLSLKPRFSRNTNWPIPNYTDWRQRHVCVNNLPRVVTWQRNGWEFNQQPCYCYVGVSGLEVRVSDS